MELKNLVCSLKQGKKLKELGVIQSSEFAYYHEKYLRYDEGPHTDPEKTCCAWTSGELGVMIPKEILYAPCSFTNVNEAIARADLLIYLLENKLISVEEVNKKLRE
jgi:hypothetical protein